LAGEKALLSNLGFGKIEPFSVHPVRPPCFDSRTRCPGRAVHLKRSRHGRMRPHQTPDCQWLL